ncbi:MAG: TorF family putative porin [Sphingomicrobium sp.]
MNARATRAGPRSREGIARRFAAAAGLSAAAFFGTSATPAKAQVGAVLSVFSDDRFRGISLSDGRPVGILDLSYDSPSGLYAAISGSVVATRHEGARALGLSVNAGYAARVRTGLTADFGVSYSRYSHYSDVAGSRAYTEFYAGLTGRYLGGRLAVSPNYLGVARWTLRGEIDGHVDVTPRLFLDGDVGVLIPAGRNGYSGNSRPQFDARIGLARRIGALTFHAAVTTRGNGRDIYASRAHGRTAFVVGVSTAL